MDIEVVASIGKFDKNDIEKQIVEAAAARLQDALQTDLTQEIRNRVADTVTQQVGGIITSLIAEPIPLTNRYGEYCGTKTLKESIMDAAKTWLDERVTRRDGGTSAYGGEGTCSRAEYLVRVQAERVIADAYGAQLEAARAEIKQTMDDSLSELFRKAVYDLAGIKALPSNTTKG